VNVNGLVVICDDSQLSRLQIKKLLVNQNIKFIELTDGQQAYDCIINHSIKVDLLITDINMPKMNGIDLIRNIRLTYTYSQLPILALSGSDKSSFIAQLLKTGANDYISKPIYSEEFLTRLNITLDQSRLVRENNILINKLQDLATTDHLTKLHNRNYFYNNIEHIQAQSKRDKKQYGIMMIDIDYFKLVNDNYGHEAGDIALQEIAKTINLSLRDSDIACRWGGEEFLIIVSNSTLSELTQLAEKIRAIIQKHKIVVEPTILEFQVTVSIGVAISNEHNLMNVENVIKEADRRLYLAKESGRNRVVFE
jgi:diguanylate cyclase (GGDEF)-like protein